MTIPVPVLMVGWERTAALILMSASLVLARMEQLVW